MAGEQYLFDLEQDGLHVQLARGIPRGALVYLEGENGAGKSALVQRFTYAFLQHNYTVTYISTELTTKGFIDQMESLGYPILDYLLSRRLLFVPVYPLIGRILPRQDFTKRLMAGRSLYDNDIIIIDTFSSLIKEDLNNKSALEAISFFKKLCGKSRSFILTVDPVELREDIKLPFKGSSDVSLALRTRLIGGNIEHTIHVNRFAGATGHVGDTVGFRLEAGVGLIVDITTVA